MKVLPTTGVSTPRFASEKFGGILGTALASQVLGGEIHVIDGKDSSHKTEQARLFLCKHTKVLIHRPRSARLGLTTSRTGSHASTSLRA